MSSSRLQSTPMTTETQSSATAHPDASFAEMSLPQLVESRENSWVHTISFAEEAVILSVNGGYLASASLRTLDAITRYQPINCTTQFLRPVSAGEAEIRTEIVLQSSRTELFEARLFQCGELAAMTHIWANQADAARTHQYAVMPPAPHPDEMQSIESFISKTMPRMPFWDIFEQRHIGFIDLGRRKNSGPRSLRWMRYRNLPDSCPGTLHAALALPIIDVLGLPAAMNRADPEYSVKPSPTTQLAVHFHDITNTTGWLLGEAHAETAGGGLLNCRVNVWSLGGSLVAQGLAQMLAPTDRG